MNNADIEIQEANNRYETFMEDFKAIIKILIDKDILTPEKSWGETNQIILEYFDLQKISMIQIEPFKDKI